MSKTGSFREGIKWFRITEEISGDVVIRGNGDSVWLHRIVFNRTVDSDVSIYNSSTSSVEDLVGVINATNSANGRVAFNYGVRLNKGLTINLDASGFDITVIYE